MLIFLRFARIARSGAFKMIAAYRQTRNTHDEAGQHGRPLQAFALKQTDKEVDDAGGSARIRNTRGVTAPK